MYLEINGFVLSSGKGINEIHDNIVESFTRIKNVAKNDIVITSELCLSVFNKQSSISTNDKEKDIDIFVNGTMIYKGLSQVESYKIFEEDFKRNSLNYVTEHIEGHFCVLIYEHKTGKIRIITDHCGSINIYLYSSNDLFTISSSSMSISKLLPVTPNVNSIIQFLRIGYITGHDTIYNEIKLLKPATVYYVGKKVKITTKKYWSPPKYIDNETSFPDAKKNFKNIMTKIVASLNKSSIIYDLTAGLDSRLILAILLSFIKEKSAIDTFVFGPENSREVKLVKKCAESVGIKNKHLTLPNDWKYNFYQHVKRALSVTDGEENIVNYATILFAQEEKGKWYESSLGGIGGSFLRDFWWIQEGKPRLENANLDRLITSRILQYEFDSTIYRKNWAKKFDGLKQVLSHKYTEIIKDLDKDTYNTQKLDFLNLRYKIHRWAGRTITSSQQIVHNAQPLIFKSCLEFALTLNPNYKLNDKFVKSIIGDIAPGLKNQKLMSGAPCIVLSPTNWYKFLPQLAYNCKRLIRKMSQIWLHRTIFLDSSINYRRNEWYSILFDENEMRYALNTDNMVTGCIYNKENYKKFIERAKNENFRFHSQLGNIITLELRMRNDNLKKALQPEY